MIVSVLLPLVLLAQQPDSASVAAVRQTASQDPIEVFKTDTGRIRVGGVALLDIDHDGKPEAFVWITPSFRQTATVLVYRYDSATGPQRMREGLAPGRLLPLSGKQRDSHTLGLAVDLSVGNGRETIDTAKFIGIALEQGMSTVRYRGFFHDDMRHRPATYLDLYDRALPSGNSGTCADFEFSAIDGLASGRLLGDTTGTYLVALSTKDVTILQFDGIDAQGLLRKHAWMRPRPSHTTGIRTGANGQVELVAEDGRATPVTSPSSH